jgi:hypothetical protein
VILANEREKETWTSLHERVILANELVILVSVLANERVILANERVILANELEIQDVISRAIRVSVQEMET